MELLIDILGWTFLVIIIVAVIAFIFRKTIIQYIMLNTGGIGGFEDEFEDELDGRMKDIKIVDISNLSEEEKMKHLEKTADELKEKGFTKEEYDEAQKIIASNLEKRSKR